MKNILNFIMDIMALIYIVTYITFFIITILKTIYSGILIIRCRKMQGCTNYRCIRYYKCSHAVESPELRALIRKKIEELE